jgi:hypothetical protein
VSAGRTLALVLSALLVLAHAARPADPDLEFFEKKVRPVLVERCYKCHSQQADKVRGGLLLDTRDGLRKGGDTGPALVPGQPERSLLVKAVRWTDDTLKMPPKNKLPAAVIADLETWIKMGAPDPRDQPATTTAAAWEEVLKARRQWWSLQPVKLPALPVLPQTGLPALTQPGSPIRNPIDVFLAAKLAEKGLAFAPEADRRTLLRRLSLVLTGLPPTADEMEAFLRDESPDAYERQVDRLLASPHFGERWARHWLDVVRFSETHGNEWNYEVHHAWRYRDYLIRAFNDDVPYDQLVREHIAGDLLARPRWNASERTNESVIGTAFYRFGEANHDDCIDLRQIGYDLADNMLDTLTKAFQATTVACARCHDHKLDAVSMKDYHALLGILRSSRQVAHTVDAPEVNAEKMRELHALKGRIRAALGEVWLREAGDVGRYLLAAQAKRAKQPDAEMLAAGLDAGRLEKWTVALGDEKAPVEDPLSLWRAVAKGTEFGTVWKETAGRYIKEERDRATFNAASYTAFGDFRTGKLGDWQAGGQGLRDGPTHSGDFALATEGDALVRAVLPAGCATHALSDRLNGTLRSPLLTADKKHVSFQVLGQRSSAVRLVSSNCQLNYRNYRALTKGDLHWITFPVPEDAGSLRVYAELMTMLDNPKFPDQLSSLGGDPANYRLPWEKAAADPRSFFAVTRVVLHDAAEPPRAELSHFRSLLSAKEPESLATLAACHAEAVQAAVRAWATDRATDDDVIWLNSLLQRGLLGNSARLNAELEALATRYRAVERELAVPRIVPGLADYGPGFEQPVLVRGDCFKPGEPAPRRYLEVLARPGERFVPTGSGRLQLAETIASRHNPLTARVMVNRLWHHVFGAGIVRTVDDFGHVGDTPSHPELLDYLAARFVEERWSIKSLLRSLVQTQAFRMASRSDPRAAEIDPENRLLHHYPVRRLEAEAIRDSILAVSGRLDQTLYGLSVHPYREKENADRRLFPGPLDGAGRRSVYIKNNLMESPHFLGSFDFPGGKTTLGKRHVTNVPGQALALLNDPFVLQQADVWAGRLLSAKDRTAGKRVERMFRTALGRPPTTEERERFERAANRLAELHGVQPDGLLQSRAVWKDLAHAVFNLQEFLYVP